jgi:hypothetical protein
VNDEANCCVSKYQSLLIESLTLGQVETSECFHLTDMDMYRCFLAADNVQS